MVEQPRNRRLFGRYASSRKSPKLHNSFYPSELSRDNRGFALWSELPLASKVILCVLIEGIWRLIESKSSI